MSRQLLAKVHIGKKELGLDDGTYRALLERLTGQDTAKGLTTPQLERVVGELKRLGWQSKPATRGTAGRKPSDNPQVRMVFAIWSELCRRGAVDHPTLAGLRAFVKNRTEVADPEWLTSEQASAIINELRSWQRRIRKRGKR